MANFGLDQLTLDRLAAKGVKVLDRRLSGMLKLNDNGVTRFRSVSEVVSVAYSHNGAFFYSPTSTSCRPDRAAANDAARSFSFD